MSHAPFVSTDGPLKDRYQCVIIGGGANGLGVARHLALAGMRDVLGLAKRCVELGVDVRTFTRATALRASGGRITHVETTRGTVACDWVVNAAGCWSREVAAMAGVELPNLPVRHEILVTEALKP